MSVSSAETLTRAAIAAGRPLRQYRSLVAALSLGLASCGHEQPPAVSPAPPAAIPSPSSAPSPPPPGQPVQAPRPAERVRKTAEESDSDARDREALLGIWKQKNTGTRWLRLRADGTGTMTIEPDWVAQMVIGDSLTMQIKWRIDNEGRAVMTSISGTPEAAFQAVSNLYGNKRVRTIVTLNDERLVFRDEEDDSLSKWKRPDPDEKLPEPIAKKGGTKKRSENE